MRAARPPVSALRTALAVAALLAASLSPAVAEEAPRGTLRVCSDPDNMPFSNAKGEGFENRIAEIVAGELGRSVSYAWGAQYRGFLRRTLFEGRCDLVAGIGAGAARVATTRPYYRSAYVFVHRSGAPAPAGFDDPALASARIGLHAIGLEGANTPVAAALARRGLGSRVVGFPVWAPAEVENPQGRLVEAVAEGAVDVALAWGPSAGLFARRLAGKVELTPISGDPASPSTRFSYDIAMAVRPEDRGLLAEVQGALDRRKAEIDAVLADYGVPPAPAEAASASLRRTPGDTP